LILLWVKAILHSWNALTEMLMTEKKMLENDIENIECLDHYLLLTLKQPGIEASAPFAKF